MAACRVFSPLSVIFTLGLLVGIAWALITKGPSSSLPEDVECDEMPPTCNVNHHVSRAHPYAFTTPDHGHVESVYHEINVNAHQSVCSLDPMRFVSDTTNRSTPLRLHFGLGCPQSNRVVIRPSQNLTSHLIFAYIRISNCTIYWKDLSQFGLYVDIRALILVGWKDEFIEQQPSFFRKCVELDDLNEGAEGIEPSIAAMVNVGSLLVSSIPAYNGSADSSIFINITCSPVFARHMWPQMAEVSFVG